MSTDERLALVAAKNGQAALMWPWFITAFDDWGRLDASPTKLKLAVFPSFKFSAKDIEEALGLYNEVGLVHLYQVGGKAYAAIEPERFYKWQSYINKARKTEAQARIPAPLEPPWNKEVAKNCNDQRETATIAESLQESAQNLPSPSPSPSPSPINTTTVTKEKDSRVKPVIDYFFNKYKERMGGPYPVQGSKDGSLIRKIPKEYDTEAICKMIDLFFDDKDPFIWEAGPSIGLFYSRLPRLVPKLRRKEVTPCQTGQEIARLKSQLKQNSNEES
jgi:hypothetical protein